MNDLTRRDSDPCAVCKTKDAESFPVSFDGIHQKCPRCGEFKLSGNVLIQLRGIGPDRRALVSGWVREQNISGSTPMLTTHVLNNIFSRAPLSVYERALGILREAGREHNIIGTEINLFEPRFLAASYSSKLSEIEYLVHYLLRQGYISNLANRKHNITPDGYIKLDEIMGNKNVSSYGFIAMWFDDSLNNAYEDGFQPGVFDAGYNPIRIDRVEHVNRIDDEIIRQINASKFVVADFTGHRGGVYFEAGYALGKGIPVFWTCNTSDMNKLHFDIRQFNCINWEAPEDLAKRLSIRIEAVLGPGPSKK